MSCCAVCVGIIVFAPVLLLGAFAIDISRDQLPQCAVEYAGILFDYATWLFVYGVSNICSFSTTLLFACGQLTKVRCMTLLSGLLLLLWNLWDFCWFIVGAVLLFNTLDNANCHGERIWQFGLANFIIQTIHWFFRCCAVKETRKE